MKHFDNDNDELTFVSLAALTANVVRYLEGNERQTENSERDPNPGDADEKKRRDEAKYVEHRLRELRAWERKISGNK